MKGLAGQPDPRLGAMRSDLAQSPWPPVLDTRNAVLAAMVAQLDRTQWLDAATIAAHQWRQLAITAEFHARHCPAFARRIAAAGLTAQQIATPDGLRRLPPLTRRDVQDDPNPVDPAALPDKHGPVAYANTSGSTGEPVKVNRTAVNRLHWYAMTARFHLWAESDLSRRLAVLRANMPRYGHLPDWGAPTNLLWDTGPSLIADVEADIDVQFDTLAAFRPDSVLMYPTNLVAMLEAAGGDDRLSSVSRWRTMGETLDADVRERIATLSDADIVDNYSSEECGYIALQCPDHPDNYHLCAETLLVEVVDAAGQPVAEGEAGEVLVTDLHNLAAPMIRYAIGDHAVAGGPCPCGRGLPTIRRILGRTRNMIVKPDGTRHWPLTGYKQFRAIAPVRQYQFRQHALDAVEVRLVTERALTVAEEAALSEHIRAKLRHPFAISFTYFDGRLPLGRNGKFEEFVSLL